MLLTRFFPRNLFRAKKLPQLSLELLLILLVAIFLFPFYIMGTQAMKTPTEILFNPIGLPARLSLDNMAKVWEIMKFPQVFGNTVALTMMSVAGMVLISAMCAYPLARFRSKANTLLYYLIVSGLMIPFYMTLSPLIKLMRDLGLMDSLIGVAIAYSGRGVPFAVFLYVGFIRALPSEIIEAAIVDGCSPLTLFWAVLFPMLKPVTTTLVILNAIWVWNDFLFPLLTLQYASNRTLVLAQYVFHGMYASEWNLAFASYIMTMTPLVIIYFLLQRNIIAGFTAGAVKG